MRTSRDNPGLVLQSRSVSTLHPSRHPDRDFRTALAFHRRGNLREAVRHYRLVLGAKRDRHDALICLGFALIELVELEDAAGILREALIQKPQCPDANNGLGIVCGMLGRHEDAVAHLEKSLTVRPADERTLANLAKSLHALNRPEDELIWLDRAIAAGPSQAELHQMRCALLYGLNRFEEARASIEKAIELNPKCGKYYRALADLKQFMRGDEHLAAMECLARETASTSGDARAELLFALAKGCADTGRRDEAFAHLLEANRLVRQRTAYEEAKVLTSYAGLKTVFTLELMRAKEGLGDPSRRPIFIIGMPRSGTTLVEQILSSHPEVFGAGETFAFMQSATSLVRNYPMDVPALTGERLRALGENYLKALLAIGPATPRATDKMLSNVPFVGLIHMALPNARFIHVVRDAVDTCLSCFSTLFVDGHPYAYDLGELGRYYKGLRDVMAHWHSVLPQDAMIEMRYESLVGDLEGQARRMLHHCGLDWDAACLDFQNSTRPIWTASAGQIRKPLYTSSVGRWRPSAELLKPLLDSLGDYATM
jgi:tetratricopeptide (TPR) repeat protein